MKAKLTFNLPEDQDEFDNAINGSKAHLALWQISQNIRAIWKYSDLTDEQFKIVEKIRDEFYEVINEHGINLE